MSRNHDVFVVLKYFLLEVIELFCVFFKPDIYEAFGMLDILRRKSTSILNKIKLLIQNRVVIARHKIAQLWSSLKDKVLGRVCTMYDPAAQVTNVLSYRTYLVHIYPNVLK